MQASPARILATLLALLVLLSAMPVGAFAAPGEGQTPAENPGQGQGPPTATPTPTPTPTATPTTTATATAAPDSHMGPRPTTSDGVAACEKDFWNVCNVDTFDGEIDYEALKQDLLADLSELTHDPVGFFSDW